MRALLRLVLVAFAAVGAVAMATGLWFLRGGINSKQQPTALETTVARRLRTSVIPESAKTKPNPIRATPEVIAEGMAHFADHCASCHANDGAGGTEMGRNLFPRVPDMRLAATQDKTDGELYWIIENGIRLTGMPAWGPGGGDDLDTWKLVHFIRHLNDLTPEQLKEMAALNPKSPAELEEEKADERFLAGEDVAPPAPHHH
jgi:mono/diheme cytochrome c family protein